MGRGHETTNFRGQSLQFNSLPLPTPLLSVPIVYNGASPSVNPESMPLNKRTFSPVRPLRASVPVPATPSGMVAGGALKIAEVAATTFNTRVVVPLE